MSFRQGTKPAVDTVELPDGGLSTREIVEHSDMGAIVPVDSYGNAILVC